METPLPRTFELDQATALLRRTPATLAALLGGLDPEWRLALVVAAFGLYSMMSYIVTQRTQEMGVRMALGAQPRDIAWLTGSGGLTLVGLGMAVGLVLALIGSRSLAPLVFETSAADPLVFGGAIVAMMSVAVMAALVPALHARRIDPIEALRLE